jgi:cysteine synthase A
MKYDTILETIGHTPQKINRLFGPKHNVWIKLERANPGASIKDRIALSMIEDAEKRIVEKDSVIIDDLGKYRNWFSNGSCGKGYRLILM